MFLIRFGILAIFGIMLLPAAPPPPDQRAGRDARSEDFCAQYPKTCDASGELFDAFKVKLAYAVTLGLQSLSSQAFPEQRPAGHGASKFGGRFDQWHPASRPQRGADAGGTLRRDERSTEWRGGN